MPYKIKGKCIYNKNTNKRVGCTKGNVKTYLKALHTNVKENLFVKAYDQLLLEMPYILNNDKFIYDFEWEIFNHDPNKINLLKAQLLKIFQGKLVYDKYGNMIQIKNRQDIKEFVNIMLTDTNILAHAKMIFGLDKMELKKFLEPLYINSPIFKKTVKESMEVNYEGTGFLQPKDLEKLQWNIQKVKQYIKPISDFTEESPAEEISGLILPTGEFVYFRFAQHMYALKILYNILHIEENGTFIHYKDLFNKAFQDGFLRVRCEKDMIGITGFKEGIKKHYTILKKIEENTGKRTDIHIEEFDPYPP